MRDEEIDQMACDVIARTVAVIARNERLNEQDLVQRARMIARAIRTGIMEYGAPGKLDLEEELDRNFDEVAWARRLREE